ncbi:MAG: GTP-binding protein, partial [Thiobacillus sp.]|nr:GTP-binding protein [Thiobacillus sp.]
MCDTCGCNLTPGNQHLAFRPVPKGATAVSVLKGLLAKNDDQAAHNRAHFDRRGILAINLMSSPGSGKTALLEATLVALKNEFTCAVIEGDLE